MALTFVLITDMTQLQSKIAYLHHWLITGALSNIRPGTGTLYIQAIGMPQSLPLHPFWDCMPQSKKPA
jgi:hypothetical protein